MRLNVELLEWNNIGSLKSVNYRVVMSGCVISPTFNIATS